MRYRAAARLAALRGTVIPQPDVPSPPAGERSSLLLSQALAAGPLEIGVALTVRLDIARTLSE